jgi:hypothetical protein
MQLLEQDFASPHFTFPHVDIFPKVPANAGAIETNPSELRIAALRDAIRRNQVTFPSQVPTFPRHDRPDLQRKLVQLYFVSDWSCPKIGVRYALSSTRVRQILNVWKRRAVELGYIQSVPCAEIFTWPSECAPIQVVLSLVVGNSSAPVVEPSVPLSSRSQRLTNGHTPNWTAPQRGHRPHARFGISRIVPVPEQFQAGRTMTEVTNEARVSAHTVRIWKSLSRHKNARLKAPLAQAERGPGETLIPLQEASRRVLRNKKGKL